MNKKIIFTLKTKTKEKNKKVNIMKEKTREKNKKENIKMNM